MPEDSQLVPATETETVPLLFRKRQPIDPDTARQYAGTDTERDLKG